jgi:hypothetical protein
MPSQKSTPKTPSSTHLQKNSKIFPKKTNKNCAKSNTNKMKVLNR